MIKSKTRVSWITRIAIKPADRDELKEISKEINVSMARLIGIAVSDFLTMRSTA